MWQKLLALIFGSSLTAVQQPVYPPATLEELLTYDCAKVVAEIVGNGPQIGPVFHQQGLVFTSLSNARGQKMLIADAGAGLFTIPLNDVGVNRMRLTLPTAALGAPKTFYLTYIHGDRYRSRVTEFAVERAPAGHEDLDYQLAHVFRDKTVVAHLEYAIFQTTQAAVLAISRKTVARQDLTVVREDACAHIARSSPALARNMEADLELIRREIIGPKKIAAGNGRMPASVRKGN